MKLPWLEVKIVRRWLNLVILVVFFVFCFRQYAIGDENNGDDLSSSYIGCRLLSEGLAAQHLYKSDPTDFSAIGPDNAWEGAAERGGFKGYLHPYVQTPLWGFALEPACRHMNFDRFKDTFAAIMLISFAATIWLTARFWAPDLLHPVALAITAAALTFSQPFQYAMFLVQTHILFVLMTVAALILAERKRPAVAGLLLALAAAVKVTPILLLFYWLITRKWKAAAYLAGWFAILSVASVLCGGLPLYKVYLAQLDRVAHTLLVSQNNQSLASWWMTRFYPADEVQNINILPLPVPVRILSTLLTLGFTVAGALLDRTRGVAKAGVDGTPPFGAVAAFLAATLFAPIAWTHYFIILVIPAMLLWQYRRTLPGWFFWPAFVFLAASNYPPLATDVIHGRIGSWSLLRGQFFAGIVALFAMLLLGAMRMRNTGAVPRPAA